MVDRVTVTDTAGASVDTSELFGTQKDDADAEDVALPRRTEDSASE